MCPAIFGDSFDCYAAPADAATYWDTVGSSMTLGAGRFSGSQAIGFPNGAATASLVKNSGSNDAIHHVSIAVQITVASLTGTALWTYLQFGDGATAQCSVVFRSDGALLLTAGGPGGTALATYTGAISLAQTWFQFEIEVVISNTVGGMRVRKLGNTSNDYDSFVSVGNLDTSQNANNYANRLTVGNNQAATNSMYNDDLLWRSDASSVPWVGDIRSQTRRPASDAAVQWTPSGSVVPQTPFPQSAPINFAINSGRYTPFTAPCTGTIGSVTLPVTTASTANAKCAIFASSGSAPTTLLGTATAPVSAPGVGTATWTFSTPVSVTQGTQYWVGLCSDATSGAYGGSAATPGQLGTGPTYASWPASNPTGLAAAAAPVFTLNMTPTAAVNAPFVADIIQDAAASYVYSSTVGQSDLYGISSIATTPASIVAVTTRAYLQKSDAGTRNTSVQLKSGSTTVSSTSTALNTVFGWQARTDVVDPATGLPWTAVGVNNVLIGVSVTA